MISEQKPSGAIKGSLVEDSVGKLRKVSKVGGFKMVWFVKSIENVIKLNPGRLSDLIESIKSNMELFEEIVISAYAEGLISLSKASELLGVTRDEMIEILKKKGIPIRTLSKEDLVAEVEAIRWF